MSDRHSRRSERLSRAALALVYISMYTSFMSRRYSIAEARSRLPSIIDEAEAGAEVELTRRGQPVAVLVSHRELERLRGKHSNFSDAYRQFLEKHSLEEIGIEEDFAWSTRDRTPGRKVSL
jgi:cellobiose PTS system EIIB component